MSGKCRISGTLDFKIFRRELRPPKNEGLATPLAGNGAVTVERACLHYQIFFQRYCNPPLLKTTNKKILASV